MIQVFEDGTTRSASLLDVLPLTPISHNVLRLRCAKIDRMSKRRQKICVMRRRERNRLSSLVRSTALFTGAALLSRKYKTGCFF